MKDERRHSRVSVPVRESDVRSTCLHGIEEPQVLNTEGERYKEGRKGERSSGKRCNISKSSHTCGTLKEGKRIGGNGDG